MSTLLWFILITAFMFFMHRGHGSHGCGGHGSRGHSPHDEKNHQQNGRPDFSTIPEAKYEVVSDEPVKEN